MADETNIAGASPLGGRMFSGKQIERARSLLARLYALRRAGRLYPLEHPAVVEGARELFDVVAQYHAEGVDVPLTFFDEEVYLGEQLLVEDSMLFDQLVRDMTSIGAESMTFRRDLTVDEVERFASVLAVRPDELAALDHGIAGLVATLGTPHILVSSVNIVRDDSLEPDASAAATKAAYTSALDLVRELDRLIRAKRTIDLNHVKRTVQSLVDNVAHNPVTMLELSGLKSFDEYTFYHSVNVAILALAIGSALSRDYRFLTSLGTGALLHDVGKMQMDPAILNKRGPLTSEEWEEMRCHPQLGARTAVLSPGLDRSAMVCILEHHMRYDGEGYPQALPARPQHLASRIVAVADAYDAMTSVRSYSGARMQDEAMSIILKMAGNALDPSIVRLFVNVLGYYPPRSVVLLNTGETAVVISPSPLDATRPRVRVIADARGTITEPFDLDLVEPQYQARSIVRCLDPMGINVDVSDYL